MNTAEVDFTADIAKLNRLPGRVLMLAWSPNSFALRHATKAEIVSIDNLGFDMVVLFR
jgi:hypothetical protein